MDVVGSEELTAQLKRLGETGDPAEVATLATELLENLRRVQNAVSEARDAAVLDMHESGRTLHEIARSAGLTRGRVFQIVQRSRAGA